MKTKHMEPQPSQTNASDHHKQNSNLIERKEVEGTPFTIIKQTTDNDKEIYFLVMGDHRLTEPTETEEETLQKIITEHWKILVNIVAIAVEKTINIQKQQDEQEENNFRAYMNTEGNDLYDKTKKYIN